MIAVVRHGETDWNRTGQMQGRLDIPLNTTGEAQALECGRALAAFPWRAIVTSPLSRARKTAELLARCTGPLPLREEPALMERDYGAGSGLTAAERERRFPEGGCPGLEPREQAGKRLADALRRYAAFFGAEDGWIAVSHGSVIHAALPFLTGAPAPEAAVIQNCAVTLLDYKDGVFTLSACNLSPREALDALSQTQKRPAAGAFHCD